MSKHSEEKSVKEETSADTDASSIATTMQASTSNVCPRRVRTDAS